MAKDQPNSTGDILGPPTFEASGSEPSSFAGLRGHGILTTPAEDNWHMIHESNLILLAKGGKDNSFDISLALAGAAFGFLQNIVSLFRNIDDARAYDIVFSLIFVACAAGSIAKYTEYRSKKDDVDKVVATVRGGNKVRLT